MNNRRKAHPRVSETQTGSAWLDELLNREPDVVVTEERLIAEGVIVRMDAYGEPTFRDSTIPTVSRSLFDALRDAFELAATRGMSYDEIVKDYPNVEGLSNRIGFVPPWATLGDLLGLFVAAAEDTARNPGEPTGDLYATPPICALGNKPIWIHRVGAVWAACFPEDH